MSSPCSIELPAPLVERLRRVAGARGCELSDLVAAACWRMLSDAAGGEAGEAGAAAAGAAGDFDGPMRGPSLNSLYLTDPIVTIVDGHLHGEHTGAAQQAGVLSAGTCTAPSWGRIAAHAAPH